MHWRFVFSNMLSVRENDELVLRLPAFHIKCKGNHELSLNRLRVWKAYLLIEQARNTEYFFTSIQYSKKFCRPTWEENPGRTTSKANTSKDSKHSVVLGFKDRRIVAEHVLDVPGPKRAVREHFSTPAYFTLCRYCACSWCLAFVYVTI